MVAAAILDDESTLSLDQFAAVWAEHERVAARLALAVGRFDDARDFCFDASVSMSAWLRHHCRMSDTDATALVRRARFLTRHPIVADAAVTSKLSAGQVRALQANVDSVTEPIFFEHAAELVDIIAPLTVRDTEHACKAWSRNAQAIADGPPPPDVPERELSFARAGDGALVGRFTLDPTLATEFERAIGTAMDWDGPGDPRSLAHRNADALHDICAFFNANHDRNGTPRHRPHIEINLDAEQLGHANCCGETVDGDPLPASATDAYLCDSRIQRFVMSADVPLSIGRETRSVPLDIFRAVAKRDGGCRHPGCNRKIAWCEAHHVWFWRHGGPTELANLVLLCSRHHHQIHRRNWDLKLLPSGTVTIITPGGHTLTSEPHPKAVRQVNRLQT